MVSSLGMSQIVDQFNYTGTLDANGWSIHSGTSGPINLLTSASDNGSSLSYAGFEASAGNRATLVAGAAQDYNKAVTGLGLGIAYYSFLLKVTNTTGLITTGEYFTGFGNSSGTSVTIFCPRVFVKTGSTAGTFNLGIQNYTGGTPTSTYTGDYPVGTTVLVVVKLNLTTAPYAASLFVNPVPGAAEPAATVSNNSGTQTNFGSIASIFFRQAGSASSGTGNLEIDEIRAGLTWASVTPAAATGCTNTFATINPPVQCGGSYTVPSGHETYTASGVYYDTIPNAGGCDSILMIDLTIKNNTTSTISPVACGSYTVPSTDETYTVSGTYHDTIPNAAGCDSIITINLTITSSVTYYQDSDGDGFGNSAVSVTDCTAPNGYVPDNTDCDDTDAGEFPGAVWYADTDGDTYGDPNSSVTDCTQPVGYVTNNGDCDDTNAAIYPGADDQTGNGIDENCDGVDGVLGIEESILANLNVYPNPGTRSVVLNLASGWNGFTVTFIGAEGKEIALSATQKSAAELEFNTESLVSGTYFIRLISASGTALVRWVKN